MCISTRVPRLRRTCPALRRSLDASLGPFHTRGVEIPRWLPVLLRSRPERELAAQVRIPVKDRSVVTATAVESALDTLNVPWTRPDPESAEWRLALPWRTLVYGLIRRQVDEEVRVTLRFAPGGCELEARCLPRRTHEAHSIGAAGVLLLTATTWLLGGWTSGAAAALTTLVAGMLWTDTARTFALQSLERRLHRLMEDLATAVCPPEIAGASPPPAGLPRP